MYLETISDSQLTAARLAADLVWRGIRQHPYTQYIHPTMAVMPADPGYCERAPQTQLEREVNR